MKTKTNNKLFFSLFIGVMLLAFLTLTSCQKDSNDEPQKPQTGKTDKPNNGGGNNGGSNNGGYTPIPDVPKVNVEPLIYNFNQKLKDVKKNYKFTPSIEISKHFPFGEVKFKEESKRTLVLDTNIKGTVEIRLHQIHKVTKDGEFKNGSYTIRGVRGTYPMLNTEFFLFSKVEVIITTETGETVSSTIQNPEEHKYVAVFEIEYKFEQGTVPCLYLYETTVKTKDGHKKVYFVVKRVEDLREIEDRKNERFESTFTSKIEDVIFDAFSNYSYVKKNDK